MQALPALLLLILLVPCSNTAVAQRQTTPVVAPSPQLVRTTTRHELRRLAYGGTVTVVGAPAGSVTIEGWSRSEVEITAEIQLRADTEANLDLLAAFNNFTLDEDVNHLRVLTTGTHDKVFMKAVARKFPKTLLGLPWKIDYRIRVPVATDLELTIGRGAIKLANVEGNIRLSASETQADLTLTGGTLSAIIAAGKLDLNIPARSWRGVGAEVRLAVGEVTLQLPPGFNGDLDAEILRTGQITDSFGDLAAREQPGLTPRVVKARAGTGGAFFQLTVGDGAIYIKKQIMR
ncbi:MAG: hypothetical protein QOD33_533 [Pyrinomonadaceae bacterium]|jgi:hypothetical protein|nr:hypothetical protein [Pyrinomonadaceae bacterium]